MSATVLLDGAPVAAWGVLPLWPGVATSWAWLTWPCAPHARPLIRLARESLAYAHQALSLRRVQAEVSCRLPAGVRFAQLVGFEAEGLLRSYGLSGDDHWLMASVPRETIGEA
jgi:hypothetical protein